MGAEKPKRTAGSSFGGPSVWAFVLLQQKKYDAAINALNTQVEADFEPLMLETKGDVYVAQNKTKEAVQSYEAALSKMPQTAVGRELLQMKIDSLK